MERPPPHSDAQRPPSHPHNPPPTHFAPPRSNPSAPSPAHTLPPPPHYPQELGHHRRASSDVVGPARHYPPAEPPYSTRPPSHSSGPDVESRRQSTSEHAPYGGPTRPYAPPLPNAALATAPAEPNHSRAHLYPLPPEHHWHPLSSKTAPAEHAVRHLPHDRTPVTPQEHHRRPSMDYGGYVYAQHGPTLAQHLVDSSHHPRATHAPHLASPTEIDPSSAYQYSQTPHHMHGTQPVNYGVSYYEEAGPGSQQRRKAVRAAQACQHCRTKKAKCDENRPSCGNCEANGFECYYKSLPPPKQDKSMMQLSDRIDENADVVRTDLRRAFDGAVSRIIQEIRQARLGPSGHSSAAEGTPLALTRSMPLQNSVNDQDEDSDHYRSSMSETKDLKGSMSSSVGGREDNQRHQQPGLLEGKVLGSLQLQAQTDMLQGELAIPAVHTTAAHDLKRWEIIAGFFEGVPDRYVKLGESKHHLDLSLKTRPIPAYGTDPRSPTPDVKSLLAAHVNVNSTEGSLGSSASPGGRNQDQALSIDEETARNLCESYFENMHILQPFMDRKEVLRMVEDFIDSYCSEPVDEDAPMQDWDDDAPRATKKRKHNDGLISPKMGDQVQEGSTGTVKPIERTIENALVLLIFAVGRVCLHKGPLPPPAGNGEGLTTGLPQSVPMTRQPPSTASSDGRSPRPGHNHPHWTECMRWPLNIDRLPGAAYFAHAASILGEVHGANTLYHVHAGLVAGLYLGQFAFVYDSWRWINTACTTWLMIFKDHHDDVETLAVPEVLAFWGCLILESDILAELELIPSGLSKYEDAMVLPLMTVSGEDAELRDYYYGQIHLRRILNRVHSALYDARERTKTRGWSSLNSEQLKQQLKDWRDTLPPRFRWDENDPPAKSMNAARLRGKYYGAQNIIHRDFLHKQLTGPTSEGPQLSELTQVQQVTYNEQVYRNALTCIDAVRRSTVAFDNLPGMHQRLIVTNIFGTAHAQFGNCLVLGAACLSQSISGNFEIHDFMPYLNRTIKFLGFLAPLSPTMNTNVRILEQIKSKVKAFQQLHRSVPNSANTSFTAT